MKVLMAAISRNVNNRSNGGNNVWRNKMSIILKKMTSSAMKVM